MNRPNVIIVGVMKCGTTSLQSIINSHPDCFIPRRELHYFTKPERFENSFEKYCRVFAPGKGCKIIAEKTPSYSNQHRHPGTAKKIYSELGGDVKIIWMLRDPVQRAVSHYRHALIKGLIRVPFAELIREELDNESVLMPILARGLYAEQISIYAKFFNLNNMHYIRLEDIKSEPLSVMAKLGEYLNIDGRCFSLPPIESQNTSYAKIERKKNRLLNFFKITSAGRSEVEKLFYSADEKSLDLLREYYDKPNKRLRDMIGITF